MLGDAQITIIGNLTGEPEIRFVTSGHACAKFSVAVNRRYRDQAGNWKETDRPSFYWVTVWRQLAEHVVETLHKGTRVIVHGTIAERAWEDKDGQPRSTFQIDATAVGTELTFATATVTKSTKQAGPPDPEWDSASRTAPAEDDPFRTDEPPF